MLPESPVKVMVVGGGGREHAICWKLSHSPLVQSIYCAPGNGGTALADKTENINLAVSDFAGIAEFARNKKIDLVVIGPDDPLADGIVDHLQAEGLRVFGPCKQLAQIEASKAFSKNFMLEHGLPTAQFLVAGSAEEAQKILADHDWARVIKADGLALGKGVFVCDNRQECDEAINAIFKENKFGKAGSRAVLEERLVGEEISLLMFADGKQVVPMPASQDHKRRFDGDCGPNTGGMGAYSPVDLYEQAKDAIQEEVLVPIQKAMQSGSFPFKGVLYAGLLVVQENGRPRPYVLEFNARFGDPETQVLLPLLRSDLLPILWACTEGALDQVQVEWSGGAACCVVASAAAYPEQSSRGEEISLGDFVEDSVAFHAGTQIKDGKLLTNGGRVLAVTATGANLTEAVDKAYRGIKAVSFKDMAYRTDIARRALTKCR